VVAERGTSGVSRGAGPVGAGGWGWEQECARAYSARARVWKQHLQEHRCAGVGLTVTVCHYPPGGSKGNPVEQRLLGPISSNWASAPVRTWATRLGYLRSSTTTTGVHVRAVLLAGASPTGERVSDEAMDRLNRERQAVGPAWNDPLRPRSGAAAADPEPPSSRDVIS
jgi:Rhodopirellula transposase DDE domain